MPLATDSLRIVADASIPLAESAFGGLGELFCCPGRAITREVAQQADVLLVRSVTRVDAALVAGTPVRFVGTATAGTDHLDLNALEALGIATASAPGSNATSVVEYVLAALLALAADRGEALAGRTLGVVGAGAVGGRLVPRARALGMEVVVCDPPRADAGHADHAYVALADLLAAADIVTLHTPLTDDGPHATRGLIGADALAAMRPGAWLVNAARGGVVDGPALLAARDRLGALAAPTVRFVLDCWPGEPSPDPALVAAADLATPHIAGYSFDGKVGGTAMLAAALRAWMTAEGIGTPASWTGAPSEKPFGEGSLPLPHGGEGWGEGAVQTCEVPESPSPCPSPSGRGDVVEPSALRQTVSEGCVLVEAPAPTSVVAWLDALQRQSYSVRADDARFRAAMAAAGPDAAARATAFAELRRTYPVRRENAAVAVRGHVPDGLRRAVTDGLGMRIEDQPPKPYSRR